MTSDNNTVNHKALLKMCYDLMQQRKNVKAVAESLGTHQDHTKTRLTLIARYGSQLKNL
jgi:hypothetical protein